MIDSWYLISFFDGLTMSCIYFIFKIENGDEENELDDSDSENDGTLNLSKITEMRLVPSDPNQCMHSPFFLCYQYFGPSIHIQYLWMSICSLQHEISPCSGYTICSILWMCWAESWSYRNWYWSLHKYIEDLPLYLSQTN